MVLILRKFANFVIKKLASFVHNYTIIQIDESMETLIQSLARRALAVLMEAAAGIIYSFPYLHPDVASDTTGRLRKASRSLWDYPER